MSSTYSSRDYLTLTTKKLLSTVLALVATTAIAGTAPQVPTNAAPDAGSRTVPKPAAPQQSAGAEINGILLGMTAAEVRAAQQPGPFLDHTITYLNDRVIGIQGTLPLGGADNSAAQQLLRSLEKSPRRLNEFRDQWDQAIGTRLRSSFGGSDSMLLPNGGETLFVAWSNDRLKLLLVSTWDKARYDDLTNPVTIAAREAKQRSDQEEERRKAEVAAAAEEAAKDAADKQDKALEERKFAEVKRLERKRVLMAGISGPMLCNINGKSKPTLYLDLGANEEFKLVRDGYTPVTGRWGRRSFQGQNAIILVPPASPTDSYPDIYTAYEDSIKIAQSSIHLTLARRSTFPGSRSAEAYEAICVKAQSLTLVQAKQLTGANLKNNPLRPEALAQRKIAAPQLSADEALACEHAKERCYEKGGVMTAMCLNALRSIRGCD